MRTSRSPRLTRGYRRARRSVAARRSRRTADRQPDPPRCTVRRSPVPDRKGSRMSRHRRSLTALLASACLALSVLVGSGGSAAGATATPVQVYGAWLCSNDACLWGSGRDMADFDHANHWLIDRGNGRPSVNVVVRSFVQPLKLLNGTTDASTLNGVPRGMTQTVVNYFTSRGVRVMLSIGGITYVDAWNQALAQNANGLGLRAAA